MANPAEQAQGAFMGQLFSFTKTVHHDTYDFISPSKADLTGRVVLITGASRGIGRALAISFTQARASGIVLAARGDLSATRDAVSKAASEAGLPQPEVLVLNVDVSSRDSVQAAAAKVGEAFPQGVDVVISNAGYLEPCVPLGDADPDEYWKSFEVNTKGPYFIAHAFIPQLLKKASGLKYFCVVTSVGGLLVLPGMSGYNIAKLAGIRLAEYMQAEYGPKGIIPFSIHPGGVATELSSNLEESLKVGLTETAELPANTLVWLTRERRDWLGGRWLNVQWDMADVEAKSKEIVEKDLLKVTLRI